MMCTCAKCGAGGEKAETKTKPETKPEAEAGPAIIEEMRTHAAGKAEDAWYTPKEWAKLCDRLKNAWTALSLDRGVLNDALSAIKRYAESGRLVSSGQSEEYFRKIEEWARYAMAGLADAKGGQNVEE